MGSDRGSDERTGGRQLAAQMRLEQVTARYGRGAPVLEGFDWQVRPGALTALLGPSGCGKTTVLRLLAGLLDPVAGDIRLDDRSILALPPERRPLAVVFQKPLLFPHLSVAQNVGFGLRARRLSRAETRHRVGEMLDLVHLSGFGDRRPAELSGGQEQRVALARALVLGPRVLLLDEPLSQLDAGLRQEMRVLVRQVQQDLALTTVLVTHDQDEAVAVADEVALLLDGRIAQHGTPQDFYDRPTGTAVARFFGTANLLPGTVRDGAWTGALGRVRTPAPDGPGVLAVRQEALHIDPDPEAGGVLATVVGVQYRGTGWQLELDAAGTLLHAVVPPTLKLAPGDLVRASVPPGHAHVIPDRNEDR